MTSIGSDNTPGAPLKLTRSRVASELKAGSSYLSSDKIIVEARRKRERKTEYPAETVKTSDRAHLPVKKGNNAENKTGGKESKILVMKELIEEQVQEEVDKSPQPTRGASMRKKIKQLENEKKSIYLKSQAILAEEVQKTEEIREARTLYARQTDFQEDLQRNVNWSIIDAAEVKFNDGRDLLAGRRAELVLALKFICVAESDFDTVEWEQRVRTARAALKRKRDE